MKKIILILIGAAFVTGTNAQRKFTKAELEYHKYTPTIPQEYKGQTDNASKPSVGPQRNDKGVGKVTLETTTYDLQTNATVQDRIVMNTNGDISAVWTASEENTTSFNDRGTGYAHYDPNTGVWAVSTEYPRIESNRCGWASLMYDGSGGEVIVSHSTATDELKINTRTTIGGTSSWTEASLNSQNLTWNRSAMGGPSGNTLHIIALTDTLDSASYHMWRAPVYYRSKDGGSTFDIQDMMIPGIDTAYGHTNTFFDQTMNTDAYAIAAKGNVVAIAMFNEYNDVILVKSTDNGDNWTTTIVNDFEYQSYNDMIFNQVLPDPTVPDYKETCDGSGGILIDGNDMVHLAFGRTMISNDSVLGARTTFRDPQIDSLIYWNENLGPDGGIYVGYFVGSEESDLTAIGQWGENFGRNFLTDPNMSLGDDGTLYISYSAVCGDKKWSGDDLTYMRHIYLIKSSDGGVTWSNPKDLSPEDNDISENMFPDMVPTVNDRIRLMWQRDWHPGIYVSGILAGAALPGRTRQAQNTPNEIVYYEVGLGLEVGIEKVLNKFDESGVYPNPSNGLVKLTVNILADVDVQIDVTDMNGRVVHEYDGPTLHKGRNQVEIDLSGVDAGMYFVNLKTDEGVALTEKVMIQ